MKKLKLNAGLLIIVSSVISILIFSSPAFAVPQLQLYINGAQYVDSNPDSWIKESWYTPESNFELWVIGAQKNAKSSNVLGNVTLVMAVPDGEYGTINIDNIPHSSPYPYDYTISGAENDFTFGNPFDGPRNHGVYDTWYKTLNLGNMSLGSIMVQNMVDPDDPEGEKPGNIFKFNFSKTGFSKVHFDAYADDGIFAPFSHDAQDGPNVPEPATISLLGLGLLGLLGRRFKK